MSSFCTPTQPPTTLPLDACAGRQVGSSAPHARARQRHARLCTCLLPYLIVGSEDVERHVGAVPVHTHEGVERRDLTLARTGRVPGLLKEGILDLQLS
jgi:hypothetical protein